MKQRDIIVLTGILFLSGSFTLLSQHPADSLLGLLETTPDGPDKSKLYGQVSWAYINSSQLDSASIYADSILLLGEKLRDSNTMAYARFYHGVIARNRGQHHRALDHLKNFIDFYTSLGDSTKVAHGLFQAGSVHARIGNYEQSLEALYRALRIHEAEGDRSSINFDLNSIGSILRATKKYDEALEVYERVISDDSLNADALMNMGNVYWETNHPDIAKTYYKKALKIDQAGNNEWAVAYDLDNLGNLFNHMEMHDSALIYHTRALKIREMLPNRVDEGLSLSQVGITQVGLKNFRLAHDYLDRALAIAKETQTKNLIRDIYKKLSLLSAAEKDFDRAYNHLLAYASLNDTLLNEESAKQVNELKVKYETEKKDQQITLLATEKELQEKETQRQATLKNAFIGGGVLAVLLAGLIFYTLRQRLKNQKLLTSKNREIREANFKRQVADLEIKALRAQINPHFIFNCMNSINQMILDGETQNASKYLTKFSKLIRLILENAEASEVSLKSELSMLEAYIQLEALRFKGDIQYEIRVRDGIDTENTYIPSMVLQPFVENAIWHGLMHRKEAGKGQLTVAIGKDEGQQLICLIEDNGVGRDRALELQGKSVWKSKSLGVKITEERLRLVSKESRKQPIQITDLKDNVGQALGTRVEVNIPVY